MDCSPPGPTVHGISQARYLSGLPFPSPGDFSDPEIELESPALAGGFFTTWPPGKNWLPNAGDVSLIPGMGRSPGEGNGNPLQYSCHNNPMDRGAWQATVHGVAKSPVRQDWVTEQACTVSQQRETQILSAGRTLICHRLKSPQANIHHQWAHNQQSLNTEPQTVSDMNQSQ